MSALGWMAASAALFASMNFLARLQSHATSWAMVAAVRSLIGALLAFVIARHRGSSLAVANWTALLGRCVFGTVSLVATFYAVSSRNLSHGNTVALVNLAPIFLAVIAPLLLGERTTLAVASGIVVAFSGVVLVVQPTVLFGAGASSHVAIEGGPSASATAAAAIAGSLSLSLALVFLRRMGRTESVEAIAFQFSLFATIVTGMIALLHPVTPSVLDIVIMLGAGCCGGLAQLAMTRAYAMAEAARVSAMSYLAPVVSTILATVFLHEHPSGVTIGGIALVITGGVLVTFKPTPSRPPRA